MTYDQSWNEKQKFWLYSYASDMGASRKYVTFALSPTPLDLPMHKSPISL